MNETNRRRLCRVLFLLVAISPCCAVVAAAGDTLERDSATERFRIALAPLGLPMLDLLPVLRAEPNRMDLFFQRNVHLTPRGHGVVGKALADFVRGEFKGSRP